MDKDARMFGLSVLANIATLVLLETVGWWLVWVPVVAYGILWYLMYRKYVQPPKKEQKKHPVITETPPKETQEMSNIVNLFVDLLAGTKTYRLDLIIDLLFEEEIREGVDKGLIEELSDDVRPFWEMPAWFFPYIPRIMTALHPTIQAIDRSLVRQVDYTNAGRDDDIKLFRKAGMAWNKLYDYAMKHPVIEPIVRGKIEKVRGL